MAQKIDRFTLNVQLAQMLKGGVIMDVTDVAQARIAEDAGAVAVMALERVPSDIRKQGGVARMSDPDMIEKIKAAVSIPVMAKARIGHFVEAQILQALKIDYIDESEVLTPADEECHVDKHKFAIPFVCGARNLGEALRRIGRSGDPAGGKIDHGQPSALRHLLHQLEGGAQCFGLGHEFVRPHAVKLPDLAQDGPGVTDGLDNVAGPRLALSPDHGRPLADAAERLAQIPAAADEGHREVVLPDVVLLIGGGQHLGLVDVVDPQRLQDLGFHEMPDPALGHDRDGHTPLDLLDDCGIGHTGHPPGRPDVGRHPLQCHDGAGPGVFRYFGVLRRHHVHDDPALQHLSEADLHRPGSLVHVYSPLVQPTATRRGAG